MFEHSFGGGIALEFGLGGVELAIGFGDLGASGAIDVGGGGTGIGWHDESSPSKGEILRGSNSQGSVAVRATASIGWNRHGIAVGFLFEDGNAVIGWLFFDARKNGDPEALVETGR